MKNNDWPVNKVKLKAMWHCCKKEGLLMTASTTQNDLLEQHLGPKGPTIA